MLFWKFFAWVAFVFSLVFRRGKGVQIHTGPPKDPDAPDQIEGPGWRRVSRTQVSPQQSPQHDPQSKRPTPPEGKVGRDLSD